MIHMKRNIFTQAIRIILACIKNERANGPQWQCVESFVALSRNDKTARNENDKCIRGAVSASRYPLQLHIMCCWIFCEEEFFIFLSSISSVLKSANFAVFTIYLFDKITVLLCALWFVWHWQRTMFLILSIWLNHFTLLLHIVIILHK